MLNDPTLIRSSFYACASILLSFFFINIHDNHRKLEKYEQIAEYAKCKVSFDFRLDKLMHIVIAQCSSVFFQIIKITVEWFIFCFFSEENNNVIRYNMVLQLNTKIATFIENRNRYIEVGSTENVCSNR